MKYEDNTAIRRQVKKQENFGFIILKGHHMKENQWQPIVGASVPTEIEAVKDFLRLKLGEMLLATLPDDKKKALEMMYFCKEKRIYVILSELMRRGSYERWRCPSLSKEDFDEIIAAAGKFYLGRYVIGEAGGILYWPKAYTMKRRANSYENLRKCDNAESAHEEYIKYLTKFMEYEREKVGGGKLLNVESSMLFNYQIEAGIDALILEMLPGDLFRIMPACLRSGAMPDVLKKTGDAISLWDGTAGYMSMTSG